MLAKIILFAIIFIVVFFIESTVLISYLDKKNKKSINATGHKKIPSKKILISIPEQTELKCPVTGDKLTKDNIHTCSCGTSYSKDVVYSRYITKCEYCTKVFKIELIEYTPQSTERLNFEQCGLLVIKAVDLGIIKKHSISGVYRMGNTVLGMTVNRISAVVHNDINIQHYIQKEIDLRENIQFVSYRSPR